MKVRKIVSHTVKTYTVYIEDGEVRPQPFARSGRQYRVERVTVRKSDGNVASADLSGPVLKKDGSDSANDARETFYGQRDWPNWLRSIVGGLA